MAARNQASYQIITTRMHGVEDYTFAVLLIVSPYLFGFANGTAAQYVPIVVGVMILGVSLLTCYELGVWGIIPMPVHLMLDVGVAVLLGASPWFFGFSKTVYLPHVIFAVIALLTVALSQTQPRSVPRSPQKNARRYSTKA